MDYRNILVIELAFIGDMLLTTPVLRGLRTAYPKAKITLLTLPQVAPLAEAVPYVDEVLVYDKKGRDKGFFAMFAVARRLRAHKFDLSVCMNFAIRGAAISFLAGIPERLGYDTRHAGLLLTLKASAHRTAIVHESENHLAILKPLGVSVQDTSLAVQPTTPMREAYAQKARTLALPEQGHYVVCPIGSYEKKNLPRTVAAELVRRLQGRGERVYLIGGPAEGPRLAEIAEEAQLPRANVLDGKLTLPELAVFLQSAACLITVDTGPLHIAQAVSCPTVAVFGPTDPVVWGPRGARDVIIYHPLSCSPCWGKGACPKPKGCVAEITVGEILQAIDS